MSEYLRAHAETGAADTGPIRFVASTEGVKRDGLELRAEDWDLDNYRKNPVVLWSHDYWGSRLPIGRAEVDVDGKTLISSVTFDPEDEFARQIESKFRRGFLNTVSVGWDTHRDGTTTRNELLDISAVPVPGDPDALMERQLRGLANLGERLIELTDEPIDLQGDEAEVVWEGTALRMARLFASAADDGQVDQQQYRRLCRAYQRLGKTPPEVPGHLAALDLQGVRGLFLNGEPDLVPELFRAPIAIEHHIETPPDPDDVLLRLADMMTRESHNFGVI